jgi:hypothetical protein
LRLERVQDEPRLVAEGSLHVRDAGCPQRGVEPTRSVEECRGVSARAVRCASDARVRRGGERARQRGSGRERRDSRRPSVVGDGRRARSRGREDQFNLGEYTPRWTPLRTCRGRASPPPCLPSARPHRAREWHPMSFRARSLGARPSATPQRATREIMHSCTFRSS